MRCIGLCGRSASRASPTTAPPFSKRQRTSRAECSMTPGRSGLSRESSSFGVYSSMGLARLIRACCNLGCIRTLSIRTGTTAPVSHFSGISRRSRRSRKRFGSCFRRSLSNFFRLEVPSLFSTSSICTLRIGINLLSRMNSLGLLNK